MALLTAAVLAVLGLLTGTAPTASAAGVGPVVAWGYGPSTGTPASLAATGATAITAGDHHGLALTPAGQVVAWGENEGGQTRVPASLTGRTVTAIGAGGDHSLALTTDGRVTAWGENDFGEADVPASLAGKRVTAIEAGHFHNLAQTSAGQVVAWGYDFAGATRVPASLSGKKVVAIAAGAQDNLALTSDGRITAWGWNAYGQTDVPASLSGKRVTAIAAGEFFNLALTSDGRVTAWGDNEYGQARVPASLSGKTVTAIAAGESHSLALTSDGRLTAWGNRDYGQDEIPASLTRASVRAIAAGFSWSMALTHGVAPKVLSSPVSTTVQLGRPASFTATASGSPTPTVRWQRAGPGGTFADVRGATSTTYTFTPVAGDDGARFRAVFSSSTGTATSGTATLTVTAPPCVPTTPERQLRVSTDQRDHDGVVRSPTFKTKKSGELLLALVAANGPTRGTQKVTRLSGGGLRWTRVQRDNASRGTSEIWQAYAAEELGSTRVTAHLAKRGHTVSLTVAGFSGARPTAGSAARGHGTTSAPHVSLTPRASGSVVWAVGRVVGSRYDPRPASRQKIVHDQTFSGPATGYWVQRTTSATTSGTRVTVSDKAKAKRWGYAAVEIRGTCS